MKIVKLGQINDVSVKAAIDDRGYLSPIQKRDTLTPIYAEIYFDSGVYPGIKDVESHMCKLAEKELGTTKWMEE